jgi:Protein of unknown function (DUF1553)/Protein of unknown function (DUF1549)/Planctomycete cytochrome C
MRISVAAAVGLGPLIGSALSADDVDYVRDVKPILAERCYSCHGAIRQKAGLRLDTANLIRRGGESGPAIEPGRSDESILIERVSAGADSSDRMPPPSEGVALGEKEVSTLRAWIDQGAAAPAEAVPAGPRSHWAYMPLTRPVVPGPAGQGWSRNPIDAFLAAAHQSKGLHVTPPVSNELLLRRVYLDLVGLTPTRDELHEFLGDQSPGAYEKVVDRLLASSQYGERWGRHWMDVWRYSDWYGLGDEARYSHPHIWQWRDWIIAALNADEGYDRMVVDMLAADELTPDDPDKVRATGYLVRNWDIFNRNTWLANTVEHTARAFLGVTIQCARCHDHKFDPISQSDYYRLRAFFEPMHIRIDRIPGQPDRAKGGLPRVFDDFMETPTFLFIRGDETRPDKRPLTPAAPAVLGGEVRITPVHLPIGASSPDKRDFVIREALEAGEQAIRSARTALGQARENRDRKTQALATAIETERQSQSKYQASLAKPVDAKQARQQAITAVGTLARARQDADDAESALAVADSALTLSELRHRALQAVLRVERLDDDGATKDPCGPWVEAARYAASAQKTLAVHDAGHNCLVAQAALDRARRTVEGLTAAGDPAKDPKLQAAILKSSAEVVDACSRLDDAKKQRLKAESAAKMAPTTVYTPRSLVYHRAKTSFRDEPSNKPYATVSSGRRLALARWIVDRRNPLTARVAVNHIWMRHFGDPLVASTFDFGLRTQLPVHHELLDWLAVEFMESGWSMKHLHRLIVTSQAYRMQSAGGQTEAGNARIDPDNHYLWRMNVKRMEAEVIRDSLIHLAGRLDSRMGGADLPLAAAETIHRRSIYYRYARGDRIPFLVMFDAPSVEECYRRDETIVPQQALALTNSAVALARAGEIAAVINNEVGENDTHAARAAFVVSAFERVLGRTPTDGERAECAGALDRLRSVFSLESRAERVPHLKARAALVHVLLNHNDFVSIR